LVVELVTRVADVIKFPRRPFYLSTEIGGKQKGKSRMKQSEGREVGIMGEELIKEVVSPRLR
jgi:hypothetical protein